MSWFARFIVPRAGDEYTYLKLVKGVYRVGSSMHGSQCDIITKDQATRFDTEGDAYSALGRFLVARGPLTSADWITCPSVVEAEPEVVLAVVVAGKLIELLVDGGSYFVRYDDELKSYSTRRIACSAFGICIDDALGSK